MSLAEWVRHLVGRDARPTMGLVLGAESLRYVVAGRQEVACEPAVVWCRRDTKRIILGERSIGLMAKATLICRNVDDYQRVHPFSSDLPVGEYSLACILRYLRRAAAEKWACREPGRLVLTGRWTILQAIRSFAERAARQAGFRECILLHEPECLARLAGLEPSASALIVDAGHEGTRVYGWRDGGLLRDFPSASAPGGEEMSRAIAGLLRHEHGLEIGPTMARDLLAATCDSADWPREAKGRDRDSGQPRRLGLDHEDAAAALRPVLGDIVLACRKALRELEVEDASAARIVLAGGAADSELLLATLEEEVGARVELRPSPGDLSARGLALGLAGSPEGAAAAV